MQYISAIILIVFIPLVFGTIWEEYPLNELVADHPVIVVGEIIEAEKTWGSSDLAIDIAHLKN